MRTCHVEKWSDREGASQAAELLCENQIVFVSGVGSYLRVFEVREGGYTMSRVTRIEHGVLVIWGERPE